MFPGLLVWVSVVVLLGGVFWCGFVWVAFVWGCYVTGAAWFVTWFMLIFGLERVGGVWLFYRLM